ncbi:MAG: response regulator [Lachnospiraceae bacterium]|nr:response regulator [Lachnospiraceae bacterium]
MYQVLLVDDEILVRDAIRENIDWEGLGFTLAGDCQNGKEAIEFVNAHPVQVVLTDINMPYVDGLELSKYLFENFPETAIIIFSGFSEFDYAQKAIQYHVSEYLLKPVTARELSEVLKRTYEKLDQTQKEEQKLQKLTSTYKEYQKNAVLIQSKALSNFVLHSREPEESLRELKEMGITFRSGNYRVAVLDIDLYSNLYEPDLEKQKESALMAFVVFNISEELLKQERLGHAYQEGNHRINLLLESGRFEQPGNQRTIRSEFLDASRRICERIQQEVYKALGMTVSAGLGVCVSDTDELYHSWELAQEALARRYSGGGGLILDMESGAFSTNRFAVENYESSQGASTGEGSGCSDSPSADGGESGENPASPDYNIIQNQLAEAIRDHDSARAMAALDEMESSMRRELLEKNRVCLQLAQAVRQVADIGLASGLDGGWLSQEREAAIDRIAKQRSMPKAVAAAKEYTEQVLKALDSMSDSNSKRLAMRAVDYIEKHYADPALGLNDVCGYLGVSTSHFSTLFKEATGETFMDLLIRTRMQKARDLLEHTSMKNYEIAERVGYSDPHYFSIVFKKMTGRTPTEYAKEKRKNQDRNAVEIEESYGKN